MKRYAQSKSVFFAQLEVVFVLIAVTGCGLISTFAQDTFPEAKITKIATQTTDLIEVQITVPKDTFRRGDDIQLNYSVTNRSKKTVFLVVEADSYVIVEDLFILRLTQPVRGVYDHVIYDYDLIKILPQKTHKGKLIIKAKYYLENKDYDFSVAEIQAGFSYLFDKTNLEGCKQATYVRPCFFELYNKSKSLTLGNLVIEIKR